MELGQIVVDATGKVVYVALTSGGEVMAFSIAFTRSSDTRTRLAFAAGTTPVSMFTATNFLYVSNAAGISGYSIDGSNGVLTLLAGSLSFRIDPSTGGLMVIGSTPSVFVRLKLVLQLKQHLRDAA